LIVFRIITNQNKQDMTRKKTKLNINKKEILIGFWNIQNKIIETNKS